MISRRSLALTSLLLLLTPGMRASQDELGAAKALYASASYEAALDALATVQRTETANQVDQYRALCLLALGRTSEAERTVEQLVARHPLYRMNDVDMSPRLVALFRDVRKRVLPVAARDSYVEARASFGEKRYGLAISQIKSLLTILSDADLAEADEVADLRLLGEGFMKLAEAGLAAAEAALNAPPPAPQPQAPPPKPAIYSADSPDVKPPVEMERRMPNWTMRSPMPLDGYRGQLEILINEQGTVESAVLREPVAPFYDTALLRAARNWQFRPAEREGKPVKFLKILDVVLQPQ